jgi:glycine dehydrogenase subunit 1
MRYFAHTAETLNAKLQAVNKDSLDDLFSSIPPHARLKSSLNLPPKMDELQIKRELLPFYTPPSHKSFLGAGATEHFVPEWVSQQLMRAEWYTSYTPYQPEASQGTLQAIFEFQSMVASLLGLEIANASMYDGATALMEALLMAVRATNKKTVILSKTIHPEYRACVHTYLKMGGYSVVEISFDKAGETNIDALVDCLKSSHDIAAVAIQSPNFFGRVENVKEIAGRVHEHGALMVGCLTDMTATAVLASFGACGADIAVGEGLGLLGGLSLGGPGVGLFAAKKSLLRQMPGRLVGKTVDKHNNPGYVLTLSTREQHIRREKATSNICTNHNLMALAFSMTLAAYGKIGLKTLALNNLKKTLFLRKCLADFGVKAAFFGPHYNETVINLGDEKLLEQRVAHLYQKNIVAGLSLKRFYPELAGHLMIATTELHDDSDITTLAKYLSGAHHE